ncbi:hypothetical protein V6N13_047988 [Hibiscus sabdariffa]|uniref:Uncharacterized protein n=1 Tax=Hibiscus sabdariffa TaxID=183260 RepID=A0ABR2F5V7_9ROSI
MRTQTESICHWLCSASREVLKQSVRPSEAGQGIGPFISKPLPQMTRFNCFSLLTWNKKKATDGSSIAGNHKDGIRILQIKLEQLSWPFDSDESRSRTFTVPIPDGFQDGSVCNVKVVPQESPIRSEAAEVTYEAEDEHEEHASIKKEFSAIDLQHHAANDEEFEFKTRTLASLDSFQAEKDVEMVQSGHISDPGISRADFWASPKLKRSCSNLEAQVVQRKVDKSIEESQRLSLSPASVMTHCSADRVMLKRHSSSQVLPSRSKRLWWKLFLWSHRNLHKHRTKKPAPHLPIAATSNQHGGYSSDTVELHQANKISKMESPGSFTKGFHNGLDSGLWPQKQWMAFPATPSSMSRVNEWVRDLEIGTDQLATDVNREESVTFPPPLQTGKSPARNAAHSSQHSDIDLSEAVLHANNVIQTLNSCSTVAHISGICLKAVPVISGFTGLRTVNLSNNFIGHITPGSLPKRLHTLNLSRNKINTIEGLRELTRLRVLDLSYNRIARIGQGLSNCTLIKELYLAGNKIGDVQGLHRLLKLTVLDLSFNKITITKELGQLAANYNSLLALNLLGNPIQSNASDDQLRKAISSLLPKLMYLNKQPIKPQRGREAVADSVAKAALGSGSWSSRRKTTTKRGSHGGSTASSIVHKSSNKNKSKSQNPHRQHLSLMSPAHADSPR